MNKKEQETYHKLGRDYWWLGGKYEILTDLMLRFFPKKTKLKILDAGCGPGNMAQILKNFGQVHGVDISKAAMKLSKNQGYFELKTGDIQKTSYPSKTFDIVASIDILEHVKDDKKALAEINRILKNRGFLIFSVPSYNFLWGENDDIFGHLRRYTLGDIKNKLKVSGFELIQVSYTQPLFVLPLLIMRRSKKVLGKTKNDFVGVSKFVNRILYNLLASEKYILRFMDIPFGANIVGVVRKK